MELERRFSRDRKIRLNLGCATACLVLAFLGWFFGGNSDTPENGKSKGDNLAGEWAKVDAPTTTVYFTQASNKMVFSFVERVKLPMQSRLDPPVFTGEERQNSTTYEYKRVSGNSISIKRPLGDVVIEFEFTSDDEFVAIYKSEWDNEPKVQGRFRRKTSGVAKVPTADVSKQIQSFEQKRSRLQSLLEKAYGEQQELLDKLRNAGVNKPSDLKGNPRGQKLAELLQKLTVEIEGLEGQVTAIDAAILDAKAIARRLEREQAGVSDNEMHKLGVQLRELEERTDGRSAKPTTPLDVEAALQKAIKKVGGK